MYSNLPELRLLVKDRKYAETLYSGKISSSLSQGRKIFRFLKFFDEIKKFSKPMGNKPIYLKFLMKLAPVFSFFYYIFDNALWVMGSAMLNVEYMKPYNKRVKYIKNITSLCRNLLNILTNSIHLERASE